MIDLLSTSGIVLIKGVEVVRLGLNPGFRGLKIRSHLKRQVLLDVNTSWHSSVGRAFVYFTTNTGFGPHQFLLTDMLKSDFVRVWIWVCVIPDGLELENISPLIIAERWMNTEHFQFPWIWFITNRYCYIKAQSQAQMLTYFRLELNGTISLYIGNIMVDCMLVYLNRSPS